MISLLKTRRHVVMSSRSRTCEDSTVPLAAPIIGTDGQLLYDIFIPKDTGIILGYMGVNRDTDIWGPDAMVWKPERWLSPLPSSVAGAGVPGVYANMYAFVQFLEHFRD